MATYLLLFVGRPAAPDATDEQTADYNRQWGAYMAGLGQSGRLRGGAPLEPSGKVVAAAGATDLELADMDVGGYCIVEADSLDAAIEVAGAAPHIALGGTTIVRQCLPVG
jgi:hypothetical protein